MKFRRFLPVLFCLLGLSATAKPIDAQKAHTAAARFLSFNEQAFKSLTLKQTLRSSSDIASIYVFDIDDNGFILITADDELEPVLGYSLTPFDQATTNPVFQGWVNNYVEDIAAVISQRTTTGKSTAQLTSAYTTRRAIAKWAELLGTEPATIYGTPDAKRVNALVSSKWNQGWGYNNYCPVDEDSNHVVTGCVATAMAQVVHYWRYPYVGFHKSSYTAQHYGYQKAQYDSAYYDHSIMPDMVTYTSTNEQIHAVSLLSYHCGVSVRMTYQNPNHTSGSGAHTSDVPNALRHFGYFNSQMHYKEAYGDSLWCEMLRAELDKRQPIIYQGFTGGQGSGGHCFVCDGYRSGDMFHFNWGWGGSADGFFTLTTMQGYTNLQGGVFNIHPSKLTSSSATLYITTNGTGDGSSWADASCHLEDAIQARGVYGNGQIWVKEGTYYGDTLSDVAFIVGNGAKVYGGFAGNETDVNARNLEAHPTILDGRNERAVTATNSIGETTSWNDLILQNGRSSTIAAIKTTENLTFNHCIIRNNNATDGGCIASLIGGTVKFCSFENNNASDEGSIISITNADLQTSKIINNSASSVIRNSGGDIKSCLIAHNNGTGLIATNGLHVNNTIACNSATGISSSSRAKFHNCLVWNNETNIENDGAAFSFCAAEGVDLGESESNITLCSDNTADNGPHFAQVGNPRGLESSNPDDFHLTSSSLCRDNGDTNTRILTSKDLDNNTRRRNGRVDIGCYEFQNLAINDVESININISPNPTTGLITIVGQEEGSLLQLYDLRGCMITSTRSNTIDLTPLPQGIYMLRCGASTTKVVKK